MSKPKSIKITIPSPCPQSWNQMTPNANGRHCAQCCKTVIDFTSWSDAALYNYFSKKRGEVCGRFFNTQLEKKINIPYQPQSRLHRLTMALGLTLSLSQSPQLLAQNRPPWLPAQCSLPRQLNARENPDKKAPGTSLGMISGTVLDERKEPMINAGVHVYLNGVLVGGTVTDFDGNYSLGSLKHGIYQVMVRYAGYDSIQTNGVKVDTNNVPVNFAFKKSNIQALGGCIVITGYSTPLIDMDDPTKRIMTREQISHIPH